MPDTVLGHVALGTGIASSQLSPFPITAVLADPFCISCSKEKTSLSASRTGRAIGAPAFAIGTSLSKVNGKYDNYDN